MKWQYIYIFVGIALLGLYYYTSFQRFKKQGEQFNKLQGELRTGDTVLTTGGIYGKIVALTDRECQLEIAKDVVIRIERFAIRSVVKEEG